MALRDGNRQVARAYLLHALGIVPVVLWLATVGSMPGWAYLLGCWLALALLRIRTFLEHQAHERAGARSVIIEDRGPLALLFLNNNFHAVHHANPKLPWYRLPAEYARRRDWWLRRNDGYAYRSYAEVFRHYLVRRKDPVAHPIWTPPEPGRRGLHPVTGRPLRRVARRLPMYDWPELRDATDGLWAALRDALRAEGVAAPEALSRDIS